MLQKILQAKFKGLGNKITPLSLSRFFFYIFIFIIPFQINAVVYTTSVFEGGNFNPFTSVFIYLADLVFLLSFVCWGISIFKHEFKEKLTYGKSVLFIFLLIFLVFAEISVFFAEDKWLSFTIVIRLLEFILMYFYIINQTVKLEKIINVLLASLALQALIAIFQYVFQGSLGLSFLGESNISPNELGIAKITTESGQIIRPYGTFSHPNILAGYLLTGIFLAYYKIKQRVTIAYPLIALLGLAFILAFSRGAFLAFIIAALVYFSVVESKISLKYIILIAAFLLFTVVIFNLEQTFLSRVLFSDASSLDERIFYFNVSKNIFYNYPLGIGIGNFTLALPDFTSVKLAPWLYQPVHNIYMLLINEIGIFGALSFIILFLTFPISVFFKMKKLKETDKKLGAILLAIITSIFVIGMFDHFLISLYHGIAILFIIFAFAGKYVLKESH